MVNISMQSNKVIITPARCGSSWLTNAFEQTYNYNNFNAAMSSSLAENIVRINGESRDVSKLTQQEKIKLVNKSEPYVVKIFTDEMADLDLFKNAEYIWLYRKNRQEHYLSYYFSLKTNIYNLDKEEKQSYKTPSFDLDRNFTKFYCKQMKEELEVYEKIKDKIDVKIAYEDLFEKNPWNLFQENVTACVKLNSYKKEWLDIVKQELEFCNENTF